MGWFFLGPDELLSVLTMFFIECPKSVANHTLHPHSSEDVKGPKFEGLDILPQSYYSSVTYL